MRKIIRRNIIPSGYKILQSCCPAGLCFTAWEDKEMNKLNLSETAAHHSIALTGGFFGIYALLLRSENFGSSETANLIFLFASGLGGEWSVFRIRLAALFVYVGGLVFATLISKCFKNGDFRYLGILIDLIACLVLAQIPADVDPVLALYPMFFATAVQWLAFTSASGFSSSTVFSTNNTRQMVTGLTEYIYSRDRMQLLRARFFAGTLICFHLGVVYGYLCLQRWKIKSIYMVIPLLGIAAVCTFLDRMKRSREYAEEQQSLSADAS